MLLASSDDFDESAKWEKSIMTRPSQGTGLVANPWGGDKASLLRGSKGFRPLECFKLT